MLAEGMGRRLDPDVDIIARAVPFIRRAAVNALYNKGLDVLSWHDDDNIAAASSSKNMSQS